MIVVLLVVWGQTKASAQTPTAQVAAPGEASVEENLVGLEKRSWEAWQKRDGKFFEEFLANDHVEVGFGGIADKKAVVAMVGSTTCTVRSYAVRDFKVTQFNENVALVTYRAEQDTSCGGQPVPSPVRAASLYVRRAGRWVNASYQQTPSN